MCIGLVAIVVIASAVFYRHKNSNFTEQAAKTGNITTYYSFSGTIAAINSQILYADTAMQIKNIKVTKGQTVKKGNVLMTTTAGKISLHRLTEQFF